MPYGLTMAIIMFQLIVYRFPAGVWLLSSSSACSVPLVALGLTLIRAQSVVDSAQANLHTVQQRFAYSASHHHQHSHAVFSFAVGLVRRGDLGALIEFLFVALLQLVSGWC